MPEAHARRAINSTLAAANSPAQRTVENLLASGFAGARASILTFTALKSRLSIHKLHRRVKIVGHVGLLYAHC